MSMSGSSFDNDDLVTDINMTPLIDVMLVLLIIFIITLPTITHAVKVDLPRGDTQNAVQQDVAVDISITADGTILWNGEALTDRAALEDRLQRVAAEPDQAEVHIRPNKLVEYKSVATVLASAQRLGVTKLGMVGNEQFVK